MDSDCVHTKLWDYFNEWTDPHIHTCNKCIELIHPADHYNIEILIYLFRSLTYLLSLFYYLYVFFYNKNGSTSLCISFEWKRGEIIYNEEWWGDKIAEMKLFPPSPFAWSLSPQLFNLLIWLSYLAYLWAKKITF